MSNYRHPVVVAAACALGIPGAAVADMSITHEVGIPKVVNFEDTDELIPINRPVIHVFSNNGKTYTTIANDNENLTHSSVVSGRCGRRVHDFSDAGLEVAGTRHDVSGTGDRVIKRHTEVFKFPFTLPDIPRAPAAACNFELDKRVAQGDKPREYWMERGFVVEYQNAYEARFTASCSGGLVRGEFASETIKTPVWIACAPTEVVTNPQPKRMELPESRAKMMPLKVRAELEATEQGDIYASKCPVMVHYTGQVWVSRPGVELTYQIAGTDWTSPERTITASKPGVNEITGWTQYYRAKEGDIDSITASPGNAGKQPDSTGSVRLTVKFEGGTAQSEAIPYSVYCNAPPPKKAVIKMPD